VDQAQFVLIACTLLLACTKLVFYLIQLFDPSPREAPRRLTVGFGI